MHLYETENGDPKGNGRVGADLRAEPSLVSAALVTTDARLRDVLMEAVGASGLPVRLGLELSGSDRRVDPELLDRLGEYEPDLVVLDIGEDTDGGIRLAAAISSRSPRSVLMAVGPELEASRLLDAMRSGVAEYVQRPLDGPAVQDGLERIVRRQGWGGGGGGTRDGRLYAFFSPKGGSGCTTVVSNLAIELHRLTGRKTLLVDLDLELGEIASLLGVHPRFHFVDLIRNFHRMDADLLASYIESHESGVHVLSAPFEPEIGEEVSGDKIGAILGFLRRHYDYVLVDTSKSLAPPALSALQPADLIFLVTNMDVPSLRNFKRCLPILDRMTAGDPDRLRLVVNRFNPRSLVSLDDLEETTGIEVYWTLPNDYETVIQSISTGRPLVLQGHSRYAGDLSALARDVADGAEGSRRGPRSLMDRLLAPFRSNGSDGRSRARRGLEPDMEEVAGHA